MNNFKKMNSKLEKQKIMKNKLNSNSNDYLNFFYNNIKNNPNQIIKEQFNSGLISNENSYSLKNLYPTSIKGNSNTANNLFATNKNINNLKKNNITNNKKKQLLITPVDPRLIYCIKMLGITKYYANFVQKKINFEGLIALTNSDMSEINIPKNIQKIVQNFILDYLSFGSLYTLDELKQYFAYKKSLLINIKHEDINKERISHSYDSHFEKIKNKNNIINIRKSNKNINIIKRNMINNFISEEDKNCIKNKNNKGRNNNINNNKKRIYKSASKSHKKSFINYFESSLKNYNNYPNDLNINKNDLLIDSYIYNNNQYNYISNPPKIEQNNSNIGITMNYSGSNSYSNLPNYYNNNLINSPLNLREIQQYQEFDDTNPNINDYLKSIKKNGNVNNKISNHLRRKNYNLKINKSLDNLHCNNNLNNYSLKLKNEYNKFYSDKYGKNDISNDNNLTTDCNINNFYPLKNTFSESFIKKENKKINNPNKELNKSKISKIKKLKENQQMEIINLLKNSNKKLLNKNNQNIYLNKSNINFNKNEANMNNKKEISEKNRGLIMNNLNNYFIYNNYRDCNQNKIFQNANTNNNIENNIYYSNNYNNLYYNDKPIINEGNLLKSNKKDKELFNNIKINNDNSYIQHNNIYDLNNNKKNNLLDLLTSPLINKLNIRYDFNNINFKQQNHFRNKQISLMNNKRKNLYYKNNNNQIILNDLNTEIQTEKSPVKKYNSNIDCKNKGININNITNNRRDKLTNANNYNYNDKKNNFNSKLLFHNVKNLKINFKNNINKIFQHNQSFQNHFNSDNNNEEFQNNDNLFSNNFSADRNQNNTQSFFNNIQNNLTNTNIKNNQKVNLYKSSITNKSLIELNNPINIIDNKMNIF